MARIPELRQARAGWTGALATLGRRGGQAIPPSGDNSNGTRGGESAKRSKAEGNLEMNSARNRFRTPKIKNG
jgi:hypothetical protein